MRHIQDELPVAEPKSGSCFMEVSRRRGDFALIGVACSVQLDEDGECEDARIALCNAGETPIFAAAAGESLIGRIIGAPYGHSIDGPSSPTPLDCFGAATADSCNQPYAPPRAILPVQPETSAAARALHATGTTIVRVDLDETSTVVGSEVIRSSGYAPLDRAALAAAQKSSYRTESFACRPVASTYQFTVTFGG